MYNIGTNDGLAPKAPRRIILCPTYDNSETVNKIAISSLVSDALPISVLQTLFDTWWHTDTNNKMLATPQISEFTFTDSDPVKSTSEWFERVMQDPTRDVGFIFNDVTPRVIKQLALIAATSTAYSFYIVTADDKLIGKFDGAYLVPFEIQASSIFVGNKALSGYTEHAKDMITFRLNEARSLDDMFAIPISGGYVTSDDDYWSLIDATCTPSSYTVDGVTLTIVRTARNPSTGVQDPVTGILYTEAAANATDDSDDEAPAASGNWTESSDGVYVWSESGVFTSAKTYTVQISHSGIDVASVTFTIA